ncbi:4'-phosphopantetheinyl transferase superfamily protein [Comamonas sp. JC664]|uniref:4'-phosphopantetheinyl transferase family protein n=1 Tax=Comamonas sp. JC664 TaxID=2801917 RepID=UPI00174AB8AF|nr:4'-phosphopantetheinyl transferase superfamily protein [Comamonas sp. JC664]MBL0694123.1 4'-phosphopantetheinyl transferase superfamily protein [Comamonas sp. JC664]GHG75920.1 hypothetical protein GCM10012319_24530 [Comamonas sp. KCTC 72670]
MNATDSHDPLGKESSATVSLGMVRHGVPVPAVLACVHQDSSATLSDAQLAVLHPNERERLKGFRADSRRLGFFLGRYAAKRALSALGVQSAMQEVEIAPGVFEQPVVKGAGSDAPVVSLSHARSVAAAVACGPEHIIGVDVEQLSPERTDVFESVMPARELAMARHVSGGGELASNVIWTMKEALSKALRCGLTAPFEVLEVDAFEANVAGGYGCLFRNFAQYRARAWVLGGYVLAIVSPKHSLLHVAPSDLERIQQVFGRDVPRSP